jgi:hypothetical protein
MAEEGERGLLDGALEEQLPTAPIFHVLHVGLTRDVDLGLEF